MDSKHTPGPWKFGETPSLDGQGIAFEVDTDDFTIAHVYPAFDSGNAALIAAAPDMYEAAKAALAALSQNVVFPADIAAAKKWLSDAITKAEGR